MSAPASETFPEDPSQGAGEATAKKNGSTPSDLREEWEQAARATADEVRETVRGAIGEIKENAAVWQEELVAYVRKHPLKAVGAAAAVGFLLGLISSKK